MCRAPGSALLCATVLGVAACGGGDGSGAAREQGSAATARREAAETRDALRAALATYRAGDRAAAADQVAEAYVSHFEEVEGPLEAKDHELKERLEDAIGDELRDGDEGRQARAARSSAQVKAIVADLDKAEAALR